MADQARRVHGRRKRETLIIRHAAGSHPDTPLLATRSPVRTKISMAREKGLVEDIRQVFDLADFDVRFMLFVIAFDRRGVGSALVDRDLLGRAMTADRVAKERSAALRSRLAVSRKSTVSPALSTARYKYFHLPLIRTYVSSSRQLAPTGRLRR